jgi:23S rRNA-/tRNA-specific pseudouridylate synthase
VRLLQEQRGEKLFVVHRLDKEVSGVIVFTRTAEAHRYLNDLFSRQKVRKTYTALLHGVIADPGGTIEKPLYAFGSGRMGVDERGKPSRTDFDVRERMPGATLVTAIPRSGRRHQLRVHFYSIGHPVVGDPRYGDTAIQRRYSRMMLHAATLTFPLLDGTRLLVESPAPPSFRAVCEVFRNG